MAAVTVCGRAAAPVCHPSTVRTNRHIAGEMSAYPIFEGVSGRIIMCRGQAAGALRGFAGTVDPLGGDGGSDGILSPWSSIPSENRFPLFGIML